MKNLIDILNEAKKNWNKLSTPDHINGIIKYLDAHGNEVQEYLTADYYAKYGYAFFYNLKNNKIAMGEPSDYHIDIVDDDIDDCEAKMGLNTRNYNVRIEKGENKKDFYADNPVMKNIRCGRIYDFRLNIKNPLDLIVISYWEELTAKQYSKLTKNVLEYYKQKSKINQDFSHLRIIGADNNGKLFVFNMENSDAMTLDARTAESQKAYGVAKAIHNGDAEAKREFYKKFKKYRDEKNQQIYNHTRSKTEAEYRSIKYQENLKSIKDIITEQNENNS